MLIEREEDMVQAAQVRVPAHSAPAESRQSINVQEIWAYLLSHWLICTLLCVAATGAGVDPDRVTFLGAVRIIRRSVTDRAAFPPDQDEDRLAVMLHVIAHRRNLDPRRRNWTYPRAVKRLQHYGYREKRRSDMGRHAGPPTIALLATPSTPPGSI